MPRSSTVNGGPRRSLILEIPKVETPFLAGKNSGAHSGKNTTVETKLNQQTSHDAARRSKRASGRFRPRIISLNSSGIESTDVLDELIVCCPSSTEQKVKAGVSGGEANPWFVETV